MILSDFEFIDVVKSTPLVSVDLIVKNKNGRILLGFRKNRPAKNCWFVPGGRILKNETVKKAFERILSTELGINFNYKDAALFGVFDHIYDDNCLNVENVNTHYVVLAYTLTLSGETKFVFDGQHAMMKWWDMDALLKAPDVHINTKAYFYQ